MNIHALLAEAFQYPHPGLLEQLETGLTETGRSPAREALSKFVHKVSKLPLSKWEELYTRTLDLSPEVAPYIAFQVWGESYQRGEFMSKMNRALFEQGIETEGELPDHLIPVLRYLSVTDNLFPELVEHFEPAVKRMAEVLREKDSKNPYNYLLAAVLRSTRTLSKLEN
jgi:nitrate reductase delta subunit